MIKIRGLHKYFNKGRQNEIHVINGVDLELPEKGMVAIFGKSGCGKTTLLNVIGGLDGFADGTLTVEGEELKIGTLDTERGEVSLSGKINGLFYSDDGHSSEKKGLFSKMFK